MEEISLTELNVKSNAILEKLYSTDDFSTSQKIFTYVNRSPNEVSTRDLITFADGRGKSIFLPKLNKITERFTYSQFTGWDDLAVNEDGYLEPNFGIEDDLSDIDMFIVPAIAVTLSGIRIGYGGGYFDRMLSAIHAPKYVLAFEFQLFSRIEWERHDIRIDRIITERRIIDTRIS